MEVAAQENKQLEDAIQVLESHPDFSRVQVEVRERLEAAQRNAPALASAYGSSARLRYVLERFDIRAECFLELVSEIAMQNAYVVVLRQLVSLAWEEFTGGPPEVMRPASALTQASLGTIEANEQRWIKAGYERLAKLGHSRHREETPASASGNEMATGPGARGTQAAIGNSGPERRAAVDAYIEEVLHKTGRRITRADIWRNAGYRSRTALERWERNDPKRQNHRAGRRFAQILSEKPHLKRN